MALETFSFKNSCDNIELYVKYIHMYNQKYGSMYFSSHI